MQKNTVFDPNQEKSGANSCFNDFFNYENQVLGVGAFATVVLARKKNDFTKIAVKIIQKKSMKQNHLEKLRNEADILQNLQHNNIVKYKEVIETETKIFLVMEYVKGGSLQKLMDKRKQENNAFNDQESVLIMKSILQAVDYLHSRNVIHRDIKPDNILIQDVNDLTTLKIADFGLSAEYGKDNTVSTLTQFCGTALFMAPELFANRIYSKPVDIWSVGIIMHQIICKGMHPFHKEKDTMKSYSLRVFNFTHSYPPDFPELAKSLYEKLVNENPLERYTAHQALSHPWVSQNKRDMIPLSSHEIIKSFQKQIDLVSVLKQLYFVTFLKNLHISTTIEQSTEQKAKQNQVQTNMSQQSLLGNSSSQMLKKNIYIEVATKWLNSRNQNDKYLSDANHQITNSIRRRRLQLQAKNKECSNSGNLITSPTQENGKTQVSNLLIKVEPRNSQIINIQQISEDLVIQQKAIDNVNQQTAQIVKRNDQLTRGNKENNIYESEINIMAQTNQQPESTEATVNQIGDEGQCVDKQQIFESNAIQSLQSQIQEVWALTGQSQNNTVLHNLYQEDNINSFQQEHSAMNLKVTACQEKSSFDKINKNDKNDKNTNVNGNEKLQRKLDKEKKKMKQKRISTTLIQQQNNNNSVQNVSKKHLLINSHSNTSSQSNLSIDSTTRVGEHQQPQSQSCSGGGGNAARALKKNLVGFPKMEHLNNVSSQLQYNLLGKPPLSNSSHKQVLLQKNMNINIANNTNALNKKRNSLLIKNQNSNNKFETEEEKGGKNLVTQKPRKKRSMTNRCSSKTKLVRSGTANNATALAKQQCIQTQNNGKQHLPQVVQSLQTLNNSSPCVTEAQNNNILFNNIENQSNQNNNNGLLPIQVNCAQGKQSRMNVNQCMKYNNQLQCNPNPTINNQNASCSINNKDPSQIFNFSKPYTNVKSKIMNYLDKQPLSNIKRKQIEYEKQQQNNKQNLQQYLLSQQEELLEIIFNQQNMKNKSPKLVYYKDPPANNINNNNNNNINNNNQNIKYNSIQDNTQYMYNNLYQYQKQMQQQQMQMQQTGSSNNTNDIKRVMNEDVYFLKGQGKNIQFKNSSQLPPPYHNIFSKQQSQNLNTNLNHNQNNNCFVKINKSLIKTQQQRVVTPQNIGHNSLNINNPDLQHSMQKQQQQMHLQHNQNNNNNHNNFNQSLSSSPTLRSQFNSGASQISKHLGLNQMSVVEDLNKNPLKKNLFNLNEQRSKSNNVCQQQFLSSLLQQK